MKIAVVGAGIVGVASALELSLDGHEVTVFEKNNSVAELSSFATGGLLAASLTQPFSHTPWPKSNRLVRFLTHLDHLTLSGTPNLALWKWLLAWTSVKPEGQFEEDFATNCKLVLRSIERIGTLCHDLQMEYEQGAGQLVLLHTGQDAKCAELKLAALKALGVAHQVLASEAISGVEPSLARENIAQSAVLFAGDGVGNCRQFAQMLKDRAVQSGARFLFNHTVSGISAAPRLELTVANQTPRPFDRVVLCTGHAITDLAGNLKIKIPGITAHSYSLSAQMREPLNGPRNAVFDAQRNISIGRLGNRIRASGGVHLGKASKRAERKAQDLLYRALQSHFPGAASMSHSTQFWKGSTWITQDALPAIGESHVPGVYLNLGHGFNGWGMACGGARIVADAISTGVPDTEFARLSPKRFKP